MGLATIVPKCAGRIKLGIIIRGDDIAIFESRGQVWLQGGFKFIEQRVRAAVKAGIKPANIFRRVITINGS